MSTVPFRRDDCGGIFSALLTPLTPDERLDEPTCERLVQKLLDQGQVGLFLSGTTGEGYALDDDVRVAVYQTAAAVVRKRPDRKVLIAQVGGVPTRRAVALARAAAEAGCDAVGAMAPHGGRYSFEELLDYYRVLAAEAPVPFFAYHIPSLTGYDLSRQQLSQFLELPNVLGMKYTSTDLCILERLVTRHPDKIFFNGHDGVLMLGLIAGAVGAIGLIYNLLGPLAVKLYQAVRRGDLETARRAQSGLNAFIEPLEAAGGLRPFKALAAEHLGWDSVTSPAPARIPPPETYAAMKVALDDALKLAQELH